MLTRQETMNPADLYTDNPTTRDSEYTTDDSGTEVNNEKEFVFKVVVIGDYSVGKTSLVKRLVSTPYLPTQNGSNHLKDDCVLRDAIRSTVPTVGTDFFSRVVNNVRDGQHVRLQFWDTAGLERYASVHASTYRNASAVIAAFDVADKVSCYNLLLKHLQAVAKNNPDIETRNIFVVANKVDLLMGAAPARGGFVTQKDVESKLLQPLPDAQYFEVSALTNSGVTELLRALCESLLSSFSGEAPISVLPSECLKGSQLPVDALPKSSKEPQRPLVSPQSPVCPDIDTPMKEEKEKKKKENSMPGAHEIISPMTDKDTVLHANMPLESSMERQQSSERPTQHTTFTKRQSEERTEMNKILAKSKFPPTRFGPSSSFVSEFLPPPSVCNTVPDNSYRALDSTPPRESKTEGELRNGDDHKGDTQNFSPRDEMHESTDSDEFKRRLETRLQFAENEERKRAAEAASQQKQDRKAEKLRLGQNKKTTVKCKPCKC